MSLSILPLMVHCLALQNYSDFIEKADDFFKLPLIQVIFAIATAVGIIVGLITWFRKIAFKKSKKIDPVEETYITQNLTSLIGTKDILKFNDAGEPSYKTTLETAIEAKDALDTSIGIFGPPGVGKSFLALEVAYHYATMRSGDGKFDVVWWIDAEDLSKKNIGPEPAQNSDLYRLAIVGGFGIDLASSTWLQQLIISLGNLNYLLVFDNACDAGDGVIEKTIKEFKNTFFPVANANKHQRIIVTSRNKYWGNGLELVPWTLNEFSYYIARYLDEENQGNLLINDEGTDEKLFSELNGLPLATALACAYMVENKCKPASYLELLNVEHKNYRNGVTFNKAFEVSYMALEEDALKLLNVIALLSPTEIPLNKLLGHALQNKGYHAYRPEVVDFNFPKGLAQLKRYALISVENGDEQYAIHRLWQQTVRDLLVEKRKLTEVFDCTLKILCQATAEFKHTDYTFYRSILPHIETLASHYNQKEHSDMAADLVALIRSAANYSFQIGSVAQAMRLNAQATAIAPDNLKLLHEIGLSNSHNLILRDHCEEAMQLATDALDYFSGDYIGSDKIKMTEKARQAMGKIYQRKGDFEVAKQLFETSRQLIDQFEDAQQIEQKKPEFSLLKKESYSGLLHDLGSVWWEEGLDYKQSILFFDEAIAFKRAINGNKNDLSINISKMIKGVALGLMGEYDSQFDVHKEVFEFLSAKDYEYRRLAYTGYYLFQFGWDRIGWKNRDNGSAADFEKYLGPKEDFAGVLEGDVKYTIIKAVVDLRKTIWVVDEQVNELEASERFLALRSILLNKNKQRMGRFLDDGTVAISAILDYGLFLDRKIDMAQTVDHASLAQVIWLADKLLTIRDVDCNSIGSIVYNRGDDFAYLQEKHQALTTV